MCKYHEVEAYEAVFHTNEFLNNIFTKEPYINETTEWRHNFYEENQKHVDFYTGLRPFIPAYHGFKLDEASTKK